MKRRGQKDMYSLSARDTVTVALFYIVKAKNSPAYFARLDGREQRSRGDDEDVRGLREG
jgi:hypothetical protein